MRPPEVLSALLLTLAITEARTLAEDTRLKPADGLKARADNKPRLYTRLV